MLLEQGTPNFRSLLPSHAQVLMHVVEDTLPRVICSVKRAAACL